MNRDSVYLYWKIPNSHDSFKIGELYKTSGNMSR